MVCRGGSRLWLCPLPHSKLTPFAALSFAEVDQSGANESGGGALDLDAAGQTTNSFQSRLGARATGSFPLAGRTVAAELSVAWSHEYLPTTRMASLTFAAAPLAGFQVAGVQPPRNAADISTGIAVSLSRHTSLDLHYEDSYSPTATDHAVNATFTVNW